MAAIAPTGCHERQHDITAKHARSVPSLEATSLMSSPVAPGRKGTNHMLRIKSAYAHPTADGREAPIGLSIVREDGVRLVADLSIDEAADLASDLIAAIAKVAALTARATGHDFEAHSRRPAECRICKGLKDAHR